MSPAYCGQGGVVRPIRCAGFVWWAGTALGFGLGQRPRRTHRRTMARATVMLAGALACALTLSERLTAGSAHAGLLCGVLAWARQELASLTGTLTGPNRGPLPEGATGWRRFGAALGAILHHERAVLELRLVLVALLWGAPNQMALWT